MKILFLIKKLEYTGAPKMLAWVANKMAERGHEVSIVAFFSDEKAQHLNDKVNFVSLKMQQKKSRLLRNTVGMVQTIKELHKQIEILDPDIIVSFLDSVGYVYLAVNKLTGRRKMVVSERVDPFSYQGFLPKIRFALMKYADGFVFQTEGARSFFKGKIYSDSKVIPNPVILKPEIKEHMDDYSIHAQQRDNRIVMVGRLTLPQKRQDVMIEAFKKIHEKRSDVYLYIYGDGADKNRIQALIDENGLTDFAILAGRTDSVEKDIFRARVFVLTSDYEGIPNSLIEAMALGVPVVSTDCSPGGARLLVENGENGFLVNCGDTEMLTRKIMKLLDDDELCNKFSKKSSEILEKFSEEEIADKWERYFNEVLRK